MHPLSRDFICTFLLGFTVHSATSAPECRAKADVVFLLDSSQSVGTANFDLSKSFIADVINSFTIGVHDIQVGLVLFNGDAHLQFHLNAYNKKNDIVSAVRRIPYDGGTTATHAAIKMMREQMYLPQNGDRPNAPNIAILVTDGISNSPLETIAEAGKARSLKIVPYIMAIGIGFSTMPLELEEVANKPTAEWVAMAKEFSDLAGIKDRVAQQACKVAVKVIATTRSTTTAATTTTTAATTTTTTTTRAATTTTRAMRQTTTPTTVVSTTERPTRTVATPRTTGLRTTTSTAGTRTKQRTTAESLPKNCIAKADVVFLLDSSFSVEEEHFQFCKAFVVDIIKTFKIGRNDFQVGLIVFNDDAHIQFHLNKFTRKEDLILAVRNTAYVGGFTATHSALKLMREEAFQLKHGDRVDARNIAILVTDGVSDRSDETVREADTARKINVPHIMGIGIGMSLVLKELGKVVNKPSSEWTTAVTNFKDLSKVKDKIAKQTCQVALHGSLGNVVTTPTMAVATTEAVKPNTQKSITPPTPRCEAAGDLIFVLDASDSVKKHDFELAKNFIKSLVRSFSIARDKFQIGLITYGTHVRIEIPLGSEETMDATLKAINNISQTGGTTNTGGALKVLRETGFTQHGGDREGALNIAIVMTDGVSNDKLSTKQEAKIARKNVVPNIFAIGIGQSVLIQELVNIVGHPPFGRFFSSKDFNSLTGIVDQIADAACKVAVEDKLTTTTDTEVTVMPSTRRPTSFSVTTAITPPSSECEAAADLVFLLDASGSVTIRNFELAKDFIKSVVGAFNIAPDKFQIGLILFATDARIEIPLGNKTNMNATLNAIANIPYMGGKTNTGGALKILRENVYTKRGGDREEAPNIAIVVTDGMSNARDLTEREAKLARDSVVPDIFAVGIGQSVSRVEMVNIVGQQLHGRFFRSGDFNSLPGIRNQTVAGICKVAVEKFVTSTTTEATFSQTETPSTKRPSTTDVYSAPDRVDNKKWRLLGGRHNGHKIQHPPIRIVTRKTTVTRYELVQELKNWNDARWHCINDGGRLAVINDNVTKAHIDRLLKGTTGGTWIAGFKKKQWFFSNGEEVSWYNWHLGEPNDLAGHEDVLQIFPKDDPPLYKWNDGFKGNNEIWGIPCFYICQFNDSTICGQLTTEGKCIRIDNTKYYYFENDNLYRQAGYKWIDAVERCKQRHGILARIRTASENLIIMQEITKRPKAIYWIDGYWRKDVPVSWTWADANGDITNSLFWSPGEPSNPQNEHCIEVKGTTGHLWNDLDCHSERNFVCQYEDISTESLTTTTPSGTIATTIAGESTAEMTAGTQAASTSSTRESSSAATRESSTSAATTPPNEETATTAEPANTRNAITSSKTSHTTMHTLAKSPFTKLIMTSQTPTTRPVPTQFLKSSTSTPLTHTVTSAPTQTTKSSSVTELVDHRSSVTSQFTNSELPAKITNADFTSTVSKGQSTLPTCQPCRCTSDSVTQPQSSKDKNSVATGVAAMTTSVATSANLTTRRIFRLFRFPQRRKTHPPMTTEVVYTAPPFVRVSVNVPEIMFLTGLGVIVVLFTIWMGYVAQEKLRKRSLPSKVAPSGALDRRKSVDVTELS